MPESFQCHGWAGKKSQLWQWNYKFTFILIPEKRFDIKKKIDVGLRSSFRINAYFIIIIIFIVSVIIIFINVIIVDSVSVIIIGRSIIINFIVIIIWLFKFCFDVATMLKG